MRLRLASLLARLAVVGVPAAAGLHAAQHVTPGRPSSFTTAVCASGAPGSGARCDSDRTVAEWGPYVLPVLGSVVVALVAVVVLLAVVRVLARTLTAARDAPAEAAGVAPAWVVRRPSEDPDGRASSGSHPDR